MTAARILAGFEDLRIVDTDRQGRCPTCGFAFRVGEMVKVPTVGGDSQLVCQICAKDEDA